jgi:uncharacterized protein
MTELAPDTALDAADVPLSTVPVAPAQTVDGSPRCGSVALGTYAGRELGVWEMTAGAMTDTEAEEVFVVVSGRATVTFDDGRAPLDLRPGSVARFAAGTTTRWTVTETLRKVYLA